MDAIRLTYLSDPPCGWCCGATQAIDRLRAARVPVASTGAGPR